MPCRRRVKRTWVAVGEKGADGEQHLGDGQRGRPVVLEDIQANDALAVDVAVVDARPERHLGRLQPSQSVQFDNNFFHSSLRISRPCTPVSFYQIWFQVIKDPSAIFSPSLSKPGPQEVSLLQKNLQQNSKILDFFLFKMVECNLPQSNNNIRRVLGQKVEVQKENFAFVELVLFTKIGYLRTNWILESLQTTPSLS